MTNDIYGIEKWGKGFFKILENGSLGLLNPLKKQSKPIDLTKIVKKLNQKLSPPYICLLYTSPSPRDATLSRMPSSA